MTVAPASKASFARALTDRCLEIDATEALIDAVLSARAEVDPRFKELMREAGLADYWRQSGKWADFCRPVGEDDLECR